MTNTQKSLVVLGIIILIGAIAGGYFYPNLSGLVGQVYSPVGTTNSSARYFSIDAAPSTAAATSTTIFNTDGTDRAIQDLTVYCTGLGSSKTFLVGAGLASLTLNVATTTTTANGLQGNITNVFAVTIATSTTYQYVASSTTPFPSDVSRIWPTGVGITFQFNATNTAACTVGVHAISL